MTRKIEALIVDGQGDPIPAEDLDHWFQDPDDFEIVYGQDYAPAEIKIATGTALGLPGSYRTADMVGEWDVYGYDPHEVRTLWLRAQAIAALLQSAADRDDPVLVGAFS